MDVEISVVASDKTPAGGEEKASSVAVDGGVVGAGKMFSLKKWNAAAMWSWDVECDTCAICRVQVMGESSTSSHHHHYSVKSARLGGSSAVPI